MGFTFCAATETFHPFQLVVGREVEMRYYIYFALKCTHHSFKIDSIFCTILRRFPRGGRRDTEIHPIFLRDVNVYGYGARRKLFQIGLRSPMYWMCPMPIPISIPISNDLAWSPRSCSPRLASPALSFSPFLSISPTTRDVLLTAPASGQNDSI